MNVIALVAIVLVVLAAAFGSLTQIFPGNGLLVLGALVWALWLGGHAWWFLAGIAVIVVGATVLKFALPLKHMKRREVANSTLVLGAISGIIGFFIIPVIGLPIGFVAGVYFAEMSKNKATAWPRTKVALTGVAASILIEASATALAGGLWIAGHVILS